MPAGGRSGLYLESRIKDNLILAIYAAIKDLSYISLLTSS
jgi:hypothetical protein